MQFYPEKDLNLEEYAKSERFPDGAEILECCLCGRLLLLPKGAEPDCGTHGN